MLDIKNPSQSAPQPLDDDEKGLRSLYTPGGPQELTVVSEGGLHTLILRCRDAVKAGSLPYRFQKWVTGTVLPSIRKALRVIAGQERMEPG